MNVRDFLDLQQQITEPQTTDSFFLSFDKQDFIRTQGITKGGFQMKKWNRFLKHED